MSSLPSLLHELPPGGLISRRRWGMSALCFAATAINYLDRANLSLAVPSLQKELGLSATATGLILSGFFWTYGIMQLPAGWLVDRFGPKRIYAWAASWWSVFTMATALGRGFSSLLACRLLLGVGEAGAYPCNSKVTAVWFPRSERALASALFDSGSRVGAALSWPVVGLIIATWGWRAAFLISGLLGLIWTAVWLAIYREPRANERPRDIGSTIYTRTEVRPRISIRALLRERTIWGMCLGFFCLNFAIYFFITWFPSYLVQARGFSMLKVGTVGAIPALCAVAGGWAGGFASDGLLRAGYTLTCARKTCLVGGMLVSSVIGLAVFVPAQTEAMALFCLSYASLAFAGASVWSLPADVAPTADTVASIAGIQNVSSGLAGVLATITTGALLQATHGSFVTPLLAGGTACVLGALSYLFVVGQIGPLVLTPEPPAGAI